MDRYAPVVLADRLAAGVTDRPVLLDVREPWEWEICRIEGSLHIPMAQLPDRAHELDPSREIVVVCHHGGRSLQVALFLEQQGYSRVADLLGGLAEWAARVDANMATY